MSRDSLTVDQHGKKYKLIFQDYDETKDATTNLKSDWTKTTKTTVEKTTDEKGPDPR